MMIDAIVIVLILLFFLNIFLWVILPEIAVITTIVLILLTLFITIIWLIVPKKGDENVKM